MLQRIILSAAERRLLPDAAIRAGIRRLCRRRQAELACTPAAETASRVIEAMNSMKIASDTRKANEQHYEVPSKFFAMCLGSHLKYSCCYWEEDADLDAAELRALEITCENADLRDGQRILELGCGWGSLTLHMAEHFPASRITAVSNSASQRAFIVAEVRRRGLGNVEVLTADANSFEPAGNFDRIVSVEMFEHLRNWREMFSRMSRWLNTGGRVFLHVFCHRDRPYLFESRSAGDWMAREFFSGGLMPHFGMVEAIDSSLGIERAWRWTGTHYAKTANAWLDRLDSNGKAARSAIKDSRFGSARSLQRWRMFFMACAECFGIDDGQTWFVGHYRLRKH